MTTTVLVLLGAAASLLAWVVGLFIGMSIGGSKECAVRGHRPGSAKFSGDGAYPRGSSVCLCCGKVVK